MNDPLRDAIEDALIEQYGAADQSVDAVLAVLREHHQDATSALAARVIELEVIVERQNRTIQQLNRRTA